MFTFKTGSRTAATLITLSSLFWVPAAANAADSNNSQSTRDKVEAQYSGLWHAASDKLGSRAPGRNIRKWGVQTDNGTRTATITELKSSINTLDNMLHPVAVSAPVATSTTGGTTTQTTSAPVSSGGGIPGNLQSIAQCESGGNPNAVSPDGQYHGAYQMSQSTYNAYGGVGSVASASLDEQTRIAQKLPRSSWPNC